MSLTPEINISKAISNTQNNRMFAVLISLELLVHHLMAYQVKSFNVPMIFLENLN